MSLRISKEHILHELQEIHPEYTFDLTNYENSRSKIKYTCNKGHERTATVNNIKNKKTCCICNRTLSKEQQEAELKKIRPDFNFNMDNYEDTRSKITYTCNKGHERTARVSHIKNGKGCQECARNMLSKEQQEAELKKVFPYYIFDFAKYTGVMSDIDYKCDKGHERTARVSRIKQGFGCLACAKQRVLVGINEEKFFQPFILELFDNHEVEFQYEFSRGDSSSFFVDAFIPEFNLVIEYDEPQHKNNLEADKMRQNYIEDNHGVFFYRVDEKSFLDDPEPIIEELKLLTNKDN